jgi:hypothetical protein
LDAFNNVWQAGLYLVVALQAFTLEAVLDGDFVRVILYWQIQSV